MISLKGRWVRIGFRPRVILLAGVAAAASMVALAATADAQAGRGHFRGYGFGYGRGFAGPGRAGFGWYGGWPVFGWGYAPFGYVGYYYPPYFYRPYVVPAAYVMPAPPPPPHEFTVYFRFDQYNLTAPARQVVDDAIAAARSGGPAHIVVIGNTDLAGTGRYNLALSRRRADTVRRYMISRGIDPREISVRALGKTNPAIQTANGVREPRNRRVEIVITPLRRPSPATSMMGVPPYDPRLPPPHAPVGAPTPLTNQ
jgi:OmpA family